jgi:dTDP-4-amino-4,6-dideoxygalactose transaminase
MALRGLADAHGLTLIEDAAHGLGAQVGGAHVGTIGDAGAFSCFANKNLPLGEGGLVVTADTAIAARVRRLRSHGLSADTWARHRGEQDSYEVLEPGFNYRLDEPRAELGRLLLGRLDDDNNARARRACVYEHELASIAGVRAAIAAEPEPVSSWHIYPLLLDADCDRAALRAGLRARRVQTSVHYPPLHLTCAFSRPNAVSLPVTEDYARRTVTVPLFPHMSDTQQRYVIEALARAV